MAMKVREYGPPGPALAVLHGGPGAPGYLQPLAERLGQTFHVLEPFQRGASNEPLSVARHIADLDDFVGAFRPVPALLGHSWGAMLALAYAAAHPRPGRAIVLVGCGTFDPLARERMFQARKDRKAEVERRQGLKEGSIEDGEWFRGLGRMAVEVDSYELEEGMPEVEVDRKAYEETWVDMLRLQAEGVYPRAFSGIEAPVLMLHGAVDTHPGRMIRASLAPHIPHLEYHEWEKCGHYPWLEAHVKDDFFQVLESWLLQRLV
jgi:pimeloyl-ACP methyl ester carboxylesterase